MTRIQQRSHIRRSPGRHSDPSATAILQPHPDICSDLDARRMVTAPGPAGLTGRALFALAQRRSPLVDQRAAPWTVFIIATMVVASDSACRIV